MCMPSNRDPHLAALEGRVAAEPEITARAILGRLAAIDPAHSIKSSRRSGSGSSKSSGPTPRGLSKPGTLRRMEKSPPAAVTPLQLACALLPGHHRQKGCQRIAFHCMIFPLAGVTILPEATRGVSIARSRTVWLQTVDLARAGAQ
jgi:hypothetical protein